MAVSSLSSSSIDVASIVSQLMTVERQPLTQIKTELSGIQTKLSAWSKVQSAVSGLRDATRELTRFETWRQSSGTSSSDAVVSASGGTTAAAGSYNVTVQALAQSQSVVSTGFAAKDTVVGGGTLRIQLGSVDAAGTAFTADPERDAVEIEIADGATLADVRNAINNADAGVSASILGDGASQRLVLTSRESGRAQAFEIAVTDLDGNDGDAAGLSAFAVSATAASGANGSTRTQLARDAELTVNGLAVTAPSNRVDTVIEGVTLTLKKVDPNPVTVDIAGDQTAMRASIDKFVTAYNALNSLLAQQTNYDAESQTAGTLQGNSIATRLRDQVRQTMRATLGADATNDPAQAGFQIAKDGSLSIDETKLGAMLADPRKLQTLFAGDTASGGSWTGLAKSLDQRLTDLLDPAGAIAGATDALNKRSDAVEDRQQRFEDRMVDVEARLTRQYSALDTNLSKLNNSFSAIQSLLASE